MMARVGEYEKSCTKWEMRKLLTAGYNKVNLRRGGKVIANAGHSHKVSGILRVRLDFLA